MKVYSAIAAVAAEMSQAGIAKGRENKQQGFKFRGIDDVYQALSPLLVKHGLVILPRMLTRNVIERQTKSGGALFYVTLEAEFDFVAVEDGSKHTVRTFGEAMDSGDKATNKAMSIAYKYAAFQAFCIPVEGDNDPDATVHDVAAKAPPAPPGFEDWRADLTAAADNGIDAFREAFTQTTPENRVHLETIAPGEKDRLKARAAAKVAA